jgi:hypothetical protein
VTGPLRHCGSFHEDRDCHFILQITTHDLYPVWLSIDLSVSNGTAGPDDGYSTIEGGYVPVSRACLVEWNLVCAVRHHEVCRFADS